MIGHFSEPSGWGQAARDYLLAMDAAGIDVVPRTCFLGPAGRVQLPERLLELEAKSSAGCDVCIQHVLPHQMRYDGNFKKNIGLFVCETDNFKESSWADALNCMDEVIVPCCTNWRACKMSGVNVPVHVVPHATDVTRFQRRYEPNPQIKELKNKGNFVFYTIGEWVKRKNYRALLKAFYTEFDPDEPVELVVKTSVPGLSPANAMKVVGGEAYQIRLDLKLHGGRPEAYKNVKFIMERLSEEQLMGIHAAGDCFVQSSFGEAWSIPAFDAMAMGKIPIIPNSSGYMDYMTTDGFFGKAPQYGWLVDTHKTQVCGITDSFPDLYTGREEWDEVRGSHLQGCMRQAYEDAHERFNRANAGMERAYDFSYERVGQMLQKVLNGEETA